MQRRRICPFVTYGAAALCRRPERYPPGPSRFRRFLRHVDLPLIIGLAPSVVRSDGAFPTNDFTTITARRRLAPLAPNGLGIGTHSVSKGGCE
jgi:hypothetical protein